jgi:hypothetical protein
VSGGRWLRARADERVDRLLLRATVEALATSFDLARRLDPSFRRALEGFEATYQFSHGATSHQLCISPDRIRARPGRAASADYEVVFFDLRAALLRLRRDPSDLLGLQLENLIEETGNIHYLFRLGYLFGLLQRRGLDASLPMRRLWRGATALLDRRASA